MNKYFTEEYMELCKNEKIRKLKLVPQCGDWYFPSGDQLDGEIAKICDKNPNTDYYKFYYDTYCSYEVMTLKGGPFKSKNPLVAKIKLLIQLLEAKWLNRKN